MEIIFTCTANDGRRYLRSERAEPAAWRPILTMVRPGRSNAYRREFVVDMGDVDGPTSDVVLDDGDDRWPARVVEMDAKSSRLVVEWE